MGDRTRARVGVVSWNTAALLDACLAALPRALGDVDAEVVVVDNASSDGSAGVAGAHHGVTVVRNPTNEGYARAMNTALAGSEAPYLIALNPDTVPPPGSLEALVGRLERSPRVGLVAPRLVNPDGSPQHSVYRFPSLAVAASLALPERVQRGRIGTRMGLEGAPARDLAGPIDWAIGAVHAIRAAALGGEPPYRDRWFMYVEDLDLCWRLRLDGWAVWLDPDVAVPHVGNAAGAQAWGDARTDRWLDATYDWYATERGRTAARAWAATQTLVAGGKALVHRATRSGRAGDYAGWTRRHGRRIAHLPQDRVEAMVDAAEGVGDGGPVPGALGGVLVVEDPVGGARTDGQSRGRLDEQVPASDPVDAVGPAVTQRHRGQVLGASDGVEQRPAAAR